MRLVILAMVFHLSASAQTYRMELDAINAKIKSGELVGTEAAAEKQEIDRLTNKGADYPKVPYDTINDRYGFTFVLSFEGVPKSVIHKRVREWCAIRYADTYAVTRHDDIESGKLITKGYTPIHYRYEFRGIFGGRHDFASTVKAFHTLVFTAIDNRLKVEVVDLRYQFQRGGYSTTTSYVPLTEYEVYFMDYFPIVSSPVKEWSSKISLSKETISVYLAHIAEIEKYVRGWESDYRF